MLFDIGNLITLGIVFLALILFRLLDRGNRSLNRVRDYTDNCKKEISAFIQEKSAAIKDIGIALDVERKSAVELMRRIQTLTREELANKVQALAQIDDRIRDYDASLEELVQMTGRVQENLNRIREESAFVEGVGKRIGEVKDKIENVNKEITTTSKKLETIEHDIERENTEALEKAMEMVMSAGRSVIADLEANAQTIERKVEEHREVVEKIERGREDKLAQDEARIEKLLSGVIEKAGSRADKIEDAAFVKLRDQAQERLHLIKSNFEEKIKTVQETIKTRLGEIQEQLKTNREEWKTETTAIETRQKTYTTEWKKDVQELNAFARQQKEEWNSEIGDFAILVKQQSENLDAAIRQQNTNMDAAIQRQDENLNAAIQRQDENLGTAIQRQDEDLGTAIQRQDENLGTTIQKQKEDLGTAIQKQNEDLGAAIQRQDENLGTAIQRQNEDLGAAIQKQNEDLNEAIKNQREEWEASTRRTGQEITAAAQQAVQAKLDEIELQLKDSSDRWETEIAAMETSQKTHSAEWKSDIHELNEFAQRQKDQWNKDIQGFAELAKQQTENLGMAIQKQNDEFSGAVKRQKEEWEAMSQDIGQEIIISAQETIKTKLNEIEIQLRDNQEKWEAETAAIEARQKTYSADWKNDVQELSEFARQQKIEWDKDIQEFTALAKQQAESLGMAIQKQRNDLVEAVEKQKKEWELVSRDTGQEIINTARQTIKTKLNEIEIQLKDNHEKWETETAAIEARQKAYDAEWKNDVQELSEFARQQKAEWNKDIKEFTLLAKQQTESLSLAIQKQSDEIGEAIEKQKKEWEAMSRDTGQELITASQERLDLYRLAQEEQFRQLSGIANDASRLEEELRRSMQDATNRVNGDFTRFGQEINGTWEAAYGEFNGKLLTMREELAGLDKDLAGIREKAAENVSTKLKVFEDEFVSGLDKRGDEIEHQLAAWQETLDKRLELIAADSETKRQKVEVRITEDVKKTITAQGEKLVSDLERLKAETAAFEEGIREEMRGADESRKSFSEQLDRNLEELKIAAENELKTKIGQYNLSVSETIRLSQRELESQIHDLATDSNDHIASVKSTSEDFHKSIEEWQNQYNARMRELDDAMEEARRRNREFASENDERITAARSSMDEIRKEIAAQTKLFDRTDTLKAELDHHVEDMSGNIDRLLQLKNEIALFENQFIQIKRLEDDVNAKMTRFLSEKRRIEVMENDFNRLLQTSQSVEEKLTHVSNSDDELQTMQVKLHRLDDAIKETEEKYQRVERKNKALQETNDGIDRNFKSLQEGEQTIKKLESTMDSLKTDMESIEHSVETLSAKNEMAREAAEKLSTLDESVQWLEKRITEMNVAREGLARLATELQNLDKDAQTQLKLTRSMLGEMGKSTGRSGKPPDEGAPPPRDRENIIRLKRQGWSVEEIARSMKISKGEVELILELGPKDT
jgi:hypothetical protein